MRRPHATRNGLRALLNDAAHAAFEARRGRHGGTAAALICEQLRQQRRACKCSARRRAMERRNRGQRRVGHHAGRQRAYQRCAHIAGTVRRRRRKTALRDAPPPLPAPAVAAAPATPSSTNVLASASLSSSIAPRAYAARGPHDAWAARRVGRAARQVARPVAVHHCAFQLKMQQNINPRAHNPKMYLVRISLPIYGHRSTEKSCFFV